MCAHREPPVLHKDLVSFLTNTNIVYVMFAFLYAYISFVTIFHYHCLGSSVLNKGHLHKSDTWESAHKLG